MDLDAILGGDQQHQLEGEELTRETLPESTEQESKTPEQAQANNGGGESDKGEKQQPETPSTDEKVKAKDDDEEELPRDVRALRTGITAERKKRQELERQLNQLHTQMQAMQMGAGQQTQQQEPVSDTDAFYANPTEFIDSKTETMRQEMRQARLEMSRQLMMTQHQDYEEVEQAFLAAASDDPSLVAELRRQDNPAMFAYQYGKVLQQVEEAGSIEEIEQRAYEKARKELEEEHRKKAALESAGKASTSSAAARGSGTTTTPVFAGPRPLSSLFPGPGA